MRSIHFIRRFYHNLLTNEHFLTVALFFQAPIKSAIQVLQFQIPSVYIVLYLKQRDNKNT